MSNSFDGTKDEIFDLPTKLSSRASLDVPEGFNEELYKYFKLINPEGTLNDYEIYKQSYIENCEKLYKDERDEKYKKKNFMKKNIKIKRGLFDQENDDYQKIIDGKPNKKIIILNFWMKETEIDNFKLSETGCLKSRLCYDYDIIEKFGDIFCLPRSVTKGDSKNFSYEIVYFYIHYANNEIFKKEENFTVDLIKDISPKLVAFEEDIKEIFESGDKMINTLNTLNETTKNKIKNYR